MLATIKRILGFIWAFPITLVGLVYVIPFTLFGWYDELGARDDALVWLVNEERSPVWLLNFWKKWGGHCIGNVVVVRRDPETERGLMTLRHEQEHVRQCMTLGIFQPIAYGVAYLALMTCRYAHPYYDNPLEVDARRAAGQVVDVIGTLKRAYAEGKLPINSK
jgi:hypothetical protein